VVTRSAPAACSMRPACWPGQVGLAQLGAALLLLAAPAAQAQAQSDKGCTINAGTLMFGAYDPFDPTPTESVANLTVTCHRQSANNFVFVTISGGGANSFNPRQMRSGSKVLAYNVFHDAGHTLIWGDSRTGSFSGKDIANFTGGNPATATVPVFGRIAPLQNAAVGTYSDVLQVTVQF
jgi:spore coat protein U-like protein